MALRNAITRKYRLVIGSDSLVFVTKPLKDEVVIGLDNNGWLVARSVGRWMHICDEAQSEVVPSTYLHKRRADNGGC